MAAVEGGKIILPEFIFYEERHTGTRQADKLARIESRVERKVTNDVGAFIVFSHFVT